MISNTYEGVPQVLSNGEWVFIRVTSSLGAAEIYRVRLDGTDFTKLNFELPLGADLDYVSPDAAWLLGYLSGQPAIFAGDGSEHPHRLINNGIPIGQDFEDFTLMPNKGIVIITGDPLSYGVRLDTKEVIWEHSDIDRVLTIDPAEEWIYFVTSEGNLHRMRWDGTSDTLIDPSLVVNYGWGWTADEEWYLFPAYNRATDTHGIMRLNADGQTLEMLLPERVFTSIASWSPDREWLYFQQYVEAPETIHLFRMHGDGNDYEDLSLPFGEGYNYVGEILIHE
jgi:hypothetical protein